MGYQIQWTYARFIPKSLSLFLSFLSFSPVSLVLVSLGAFSLIVITGVEGTKTNTSFWIFFLGTVNGIMFFSIAVKTLNLRDILPFFFNHIDIGIYCKGVMATIPVFGPFGTNLFDGPGLSY